MSRVLPYGESFKEGDVVGLYISLPPDGNETSFFKQRRLRKPFMFKGQLYFESIDYSPTKKYVELAEFEATPFRDTTRPEAPERPPVIHGSKIIIYKNGVCQGVMFEDLFAPMPIEQNAKERDQITFDDGTLGYYPCVSVYRNGTATVNFGPHFAYSPGPDPEEEARKIASKKDRQQPAIKGEPTLTSDINLWRPMSERWDEHLIEECLIDLVDEVELWVSESARQLAALNVPPVKISQARAERTLREDYSSPGADYDGGDLGSSSSRPKVRSSLREHEEDTDGDVGMDSGMDRDQDRDQDYDIDRPQSPRERDNDRDDTEMDQEGSMVDDERGNRSQDEEYDEDRSDEEGPPY